MSDCSAVAIGKRIKKLRNNIKENGKRISQEEFAKKIGHSREQVAKWETGKQPLMPEQLDKIASFFGITIDKLVTDTDSKNRSVAEATGLSDGAIEFLKSLKGDYYIPFVTTDSDELDATSIGENLWVKGQNFVSVEVEGGYPDEMRYIINLLLSTANGKMILAMLYKFVTVDFDDAYNNNEPCYELSYNTYNKERKNTSIPVSLMRYAVLQAINSKLEELRHDVEGDEY